MSHFSTLVFSHTPDEVDELLAPFCEEVQANSPYAVFQEDPKADVDENTGRRGYWHNPNARWDWWSWPGRWRSSLKLKEGRQGKRATLSKYDKPEHDLPGYCDRAFVCDINFSRDEELYRKACRRWEVIVEGAKQYTPDELGDYISLYKPEFYLHRYGDKEFYATYESSCIPYAFISADGEWHSCGHMGWFGCDDSSQESMKAYHAEFIAYLEEAKKQGLIVSMMDLHI